MPTIPELPAAVQTGLQDELPVSQGGVTRAVTVAELLSGTQQLIEVPSPSVLGRASLGPGGPEALSLGLGLGLQAAALVANGGDHAAFVQETSFGAGDEVIVNAGGVPRRLPVPALRALFSGGHNVTIDTNGVIAASTDPSVAGSLTTLSQGVSAADASIAALGAKIPPGGFAGLNGNGQVTAPIAGDVSVATLVSSGASLARTLAARAVDTYNLLDFGAMMGGPDCSAAFVAAFAQMPPGGGEIFVPAGDYWLTSPVVLAGKPIMLRGAGKGLTRIHIQHTGIGLDFAPGNILSKILIADLSLYAESPLGQSAAGIRISFPSVTAFGYVTATVNDVELFGYPNGANAVAPFPQTFLRGLVLNNCWSAQVNNVSWFGPPAIAGSTSSAVVELNGSVDTRIHAIQAYYGNAVVLQTGYCEGIYLSNPLVVGADYLVRQTDETKWPGYAVGRAMLLGLWAANGEVNTNLGTVQLANVTDGFFANLDITRDGGPNTAQALFGLTNVSNFHVTGCNFVGGPAGGNGQDIAFQFTSTVNSSSNIIDGCHFEDMATVIQIIGPNGTVGLTTFGLHLGNVPMATAIIDPTSQDAGNYISFATPSQAGVPAGIGNTKDHVLANANGGVLFRVNNVASAANFARIQPATASNPPTLCFDGSDTVVNGVIQTKGGNLYVNASGGAGGSGNLMSMVNTAGATSWPVIQNATAGNLSLLGTNAGGLAVQPKGALWLSPGGGLFAGGLPTTKPTAGSGQVWNNGGVLSIA
jgi:hypothetical protein